METLLTPFEGLVENLEEQKEQPFRNRSVGSVASETISLFNSFVNKNSGLATIFIN
jgi:hypothetical protein